MRRVPLLVAGACFVLAVVMLVFAEGARRIYTTALFVGLGIGALLNGKRRTPDSR